MAPSTSLAIVAIGPRLLALHVAEGSLDPTPSTGGGGSGIETDVRGLSVHSQSLGDVGSGLPIQVRQRPAPSLDELGPRPFLALDASELSKSAGGVD